MIHKVTEMAVAQGGLYYRTGRNDSDHGPVRQEELEELVKQGSVTRNTEVRRDGSHVWIRLARFLNIPESQLPDQQALSDPEWSRLINEFVIDSGTVNDSRKAPSKPPAPKVDRWSCRLYGKEIGPMEVPLLRAMAEQGQISPTDRVRREGDAKWVLADSIPGLFDGLSLTPKDAGTRPLLGISPQRFSNLIPKAKKKKKQPPKPPAEAKSAPDKPAAPPAVNARSKPESTNPSATPATTASSPALGTGASAHAGASNSSPPAAAPVAPPPQPSIPAAAAKPPYSSSAFGGGAASAYQKPAFTPPPRPARKHKREWSVSMPEMGGMDFKQMAMGFVVFVLVVGVWWAVGGLSLIYKLIFE
jgi:hypothetical protein